MPDVDGNPDTKEIYAHWNAQKTITSEMMDVANDLHRFNADLTTASTNSRIAAIKTAHPDCAVCQAFAGKLPVPTVPED